MKTAELFESSRDALYIKRDYRQWKRLVNMPSPTIKKLLDDEEAAREGLTDKDMDVKHTDMKYRGALRAILTMRKKSLSQWTYEDVNWMSRQLAYITRRAAQDGVLYKTDSNGKKTPTQKLLDLWYWGHMPSGLNPSKFDR